MADPAAPGQAVAPPAGSVERWCWDFILAAELEHKLNPSAPPDGRRAEFWELEAPARRLTAPGRPAQWERALRSKRTPKLAALREPAARRRMLQIFIHHELQAAELFAWALLAFPRTPLAFRQGLLRLCGEELAHLALYRAHLEQLGGELSMQVARDWFWERVAGCASPASFLAFQGLGLEGANLDHSARFAGGFRAAGDEDGARLLERVGRDEESHVAFAVHWFVFFAGQLDYASWKRALPTPLTPAVFKGNLINHAARARAGLQPEFLSDLEREPAARGERAKDA